jgi:hypothetical protein
MGSVRQARLRLTTLAAGVLLMVAAALVVPHLSAESGQEPRTPGFVAPPAVESPGQVTQPTSATPAVWSRPTTTSAAEFARAFAEAIWTYDARVPYTAWSQAIGSWADPLGSPASARVAMSMLPPAPAYEGLREQSAAATARVTSVAVPEAATRLASQAPTGWQVFMVHGTQRVRTSTGKYEAARQVSIATVCDPTCWLYSATPELPE